MHISYFDDDEEIHRNLLVCTFNCPPSFCDKIEFDNNIIPAHVPQTTLPSHLKINRGDNIEIGCNFLGNRCFEKLFKTILLKYYLIHS